MFISNNAAYAAPDCEVSTLRTSFLCESTGAETEGYNDLGTFEW